MTHEPDQKLNRLQQYFADREVKKLQTENYSKVREKISSILGRVVNFDLKARPPNRIRELEQQLVLLGNNIDHDHLVDIINDLSTTFKQQAFLELDEYYFLGRADLYENDFHKLPLVASSLNDSMVIKGGVHTFIIDYYEDCLLSPHERFAAYSDLPSGSTHG